jgi:signal transduction histidine kinase
MLAGGMAHALNNPLTAVLGFAELIAEATDEARVKADAGMIVREALADAEDGGCVAGVLAADWPAG